MKSIIVIISELNIVNYVKKENKNQRKLSFHNYKI